MSKLVFKINVLSPRGEVKGTASKSVTRRINNLRRTAICSDIGLHQSNIPARVIFYNTQQSKSRLKTKITFLVGNSNTLSTMIGKKWKKDKANFCGIELLLQVVENVTIQTLFGAPQSTFFWLLFSNSLEISQFPFMPCFTYHNENVIL